MSSALRNAQKRVAHKERAQPAARKKLGLLEKKKDYRERAKDFHRKEETLKRLRRKAEDKNPDEFRFAMEHQRTEGGVHVGRPAEKSKYTQEELKLMKTQDVGYVRAKAQAEASKVARLRAELHLIGGGAGEKAKHTVFVDDEAEAAAFDPAAHFDTAPELLDRRENRLRNKQLEEAPAVRGAGGLAAAKREVRKAEKRKAEAYKELAGRIDKHAKLARTAEAMQMQKEVAGKGRKRKLVVQGEDGQTHKVFKWAKVRTR